MRSSTIRFTVCLFIATVFVLTGQTLVTAWRTETGMSMLRSQWRGTFGELFRIKSRPLLTRSPRQRAELFLQESNRLERLFPQDATKAAGGAFMLSSPASDSMGYLARSISVANPKAAPRGLIIEYGNIARPNHNSKPTVQQRILELTKRATQLEPENVAWWQLRAMLLIPHSNHALGNAQRDPNWEAILSECIEHDPNNALYDFLLAHFYWTSNAEREKSARSEILEHRVLVGGRDFEKGTLCFQRGLQKPNSEFRLGALHAAANEFLESSSVPISQRPKLIEVQLFRTRYSSLLGSLASWQELRALNASHRGEPAEAVKCHQQTLHMIEQFRNSSAMAQYDHIVASKRELAANRIKEIATEQSQEFTKTELTEFDEQVDAIRWDRWIAGTAFGAYRLEISAQKARGERVAPFRLTREHNALAFYLLPTCVVLPLIVAGSAWLMMLVARDPNTPALQPLAAPKASRVLMAILLFTLSLGFTYVTFGMAPAGFIAQDLQAVIITLVLIIAPIVSAIWVLSKLLIQKELRFSLRRTMAAMFACCLVCALVASSGLGLDAFKSIPFQLWIPATGGRGIQQFTLLSTSLPTDRSMMFKWYVAGCQWAAHYGHILTILIWGGLLSIIKPSSSTNNLSSLNKSDEPKGKTLLTRLRFLVAPIVRPFIALFAICLIAYLLLAPGMLKSIEDKYQNQLAAVLTPDALWLKVHERAESLRELYPLEDFPTQHFSPLPDEQLKRQLESLRSKP